MPANYADPGQFSDAWYGAPQLRADARYANPGQFRFGTAHYGTPAVNDPVYVDPGAFSDQLYAAPQGYDPLALAQWWAAEQNAGGQWFGAGAVQPANAWGGYASYDPQLFGMGAADHGGFLEDTTSRALAALAVFLLVRKFWPKRRKR